MTRTQFRLAFEIIAGLAALIVLCLD